MMLPEWLSATDPGAMFRALPNLREKVVPGPGGIVRFRLPVSARKLRLVDCGFARHVWDHLPDPACREAVEVTERIADGHVGRAERDAALAAASSILGRTVIGFALTPGVSPTHIYATVQLAEADRGAERVVQCQLIRCVLGIRRHHLPFDPQWRSESAIALARTAYDTRNFTLLPILADALEEAGCDHADVLTHCRDPNGVHVRGCWVVDGVLGKQ